MEDFQYSDPNKLSCFAVYNEGGRYQDLRVTEAEAFNDLLGRHLPTEVKHWDCDEDGWTFDLAVLTLEIHNEADTPIHVNAQSDTMMRRFLDPLRVELRGYTAESLGFYFNSTGFAVLLLQLAETCVVWLERWQEHQLRSNHPQGMARLLRASDLQIDAMHKYTSTEERLRLAARQNAIAPKPYSVEEICGWYSVFDNSSGLDISSVEDTTRHILGKSIEEICKEITHPQWYHGGFYGGKLVNDDIRILHVEPVFRADLVRRFLERKREIHEDLLQMSYQDLRRCVSGRTIRHHSREDTIEDLAQVLAEPSVTFHGAPRHKIESIVRYGFVVPGDDIGKTGVALEIARGASFGIGIYSSPDPYFAMIYGEWNRGTYGAERSGAYRASHARGRKILVCATLMGRAATMRYGEVRRKNGLLLDTTHSHVSPDQKEYTVFDSAQIIPCYVVHLADHPDLINEKYMAKHNTIKLSQAVLKGSAYNDEPKDYDRRGNEIKWPGQEEKKKRAIKAGAAKHFPFGFGPATGSNFVIEDVADVSDDEEVYGEFQKQRIEQGTEIREKYESRGTNWLDEYQLVRKKNFEVLCDQ